MAGAQSETWTTQDVAYSFALWWREAGLHSLTSAEPHGWLEAEAPIAPVPPRIAETPTAPPRSPQPARAAEPRMAGGPMPTELAAFLAWLALDPAQPDAAWSGPACLPPLRTEAPLLILADMPDGEIAEPDMPFAPQVARFLAAMLGAIGLTLEDAAIAPLAIRRPPGGLIDEPTMAALATRTRHYLALARPRAALILGDRTSRALIAAAGDAGRGSLGEIQYEGGMLRATALPSPDHLMRRPSAKAASWQALRLLTGVIAA